MSGSRLGKLGTNASADEDEDVSRLGLLGLISLAPCHSIATASTDPSSESESNVLPEVLLHHESEEEEPEEDDRKDDGLEVDLSPDAEPDLAVGNCEGDRSRSGVRSRSSGRQPSAPHTCPFPSTFNDDEPETRGEQQQDTPQLCS